MAALKEFDQPLGVSLVERSIMYEFCKLIVFPGTKRAPWLYIWWFRRF